MPYSFDIDEAAARAPITGLFVAYLRTFAGWDEAIRCARTGPIGGDLSHEFIVLRGDRRVSGLLRQRRTQSAGARRGDRLRRRSSRSSSMDLGLCRTEDVHDAARFDREFPPEEGAARGIEVGQIFYFGTQIF